MKKALRQKWWGESDRLRHVCLKSSEAAATLQLLFSADSGCSWSTYEPVKFTFQSVNITNIISGSKVNLQELIEKICTLFKNSYKWISSTMIIWSLGRNLRLNRVRSSHPIIVSITPVFKINKAENESSIKQIKWGSSKGNCVCIILLSSKRPHKSEPCNPSLRHSYFKRLTVHRTAHLR